MEILRKNKLKNNCIRPYFKNYIFYTKDTKEIKRTKNTKQKRKVKDMKKNYMEIITNTIIKKRRLGVKSVKPQTIDPEYGDIYSFDAYDNFNAAAYALYKAGVIEIVPVSKYDEWGWKERMSKDYIAKYGYPMIRKIVFKEDKDEEVLKAYLTAKFHK